MIPLIRTFDIVDVRTGFKLNLAHGDKAAAVLAGAEEMMWPLRDFGRDSDILGCFNNEFR